MYIVLFLIKLIAKFPLYISLCEKLSASILKVQSSYNLSYLLSWFTCMYNINSSSLKTFVCTACYIPNNKNEKYKIKNERYLFIKITGKLRFEDFLNKKLTIIVN